ncbi:MAG: ABC transporter permease [Euryarchaeota archaeon]|nr:ABC transporter permease [Euryarchaeota archaeon]
MAMRNLWRTFKNSAWLGWQMESNWADPYLFAIYSIVKPIAGTLILVFMYIFLSYAGGGGPTNPSLFGYMYLGNALFMYVAQVLFGVTWVIHDDREHYQTLKYIYISPANFYVYILGRSVSKIAVTTIGVIVTIIFGVTALGIQMPLSNISWPLMLLGMSIGLACIIAFGLALAGVSFLTARHAGGMNEGIAGIFYLFCGAIFPITVLPSWSWPLASVLPITYWLYVMRVAFFGLGSGVASYDAMLAGYDIMQGLLILTVSTLIFIALSFVIFRFGDYMARKKGLIDMTTGY